MGIAASFGPPEEEAPELEPGSREACLINETKIEIRNRIRIARPAWRAK